MKMLLAVALMAVVTVGDACSLSADLARVQVSPNGDRLTLVVANGGVTACGRVVAEVDMPTFAAVNLGVPLPTGCYTVADGVKSVWRCELASLAVSGSATLAGEFGFSEGRPACFEVRVGAAAGGGVKVMTSAAKQICQK